MLAAKYVGFPQNINYGFIWNDKYPESAPLKLAHFPAGHIRGWRLHFIYIYLKDAGVRVCLFMAACVCVPVVQNLKPHGDICITHYSHWLHKSPAAPGPLHPPLLFKIYEHFPVHSLSRLKYDSYTVLAKHTFSIRACAVSMEVFCPLLSH